MSSLSTHELLHYVVCKPEVLPNTGQSLLLAQGVSVLDAFPPLPSAPVSAGRAVGHVLAAAGIRPDAADGVGDGSAASLPLPASGPAAMGSWHAAPGLLSLFLKGVMDVLLGTLLLVLTAPCFLAIIAASGLDGGPVFSRIGASAPADALSPA